MKIKNISDVREVLSSEISLVQKGERKSKDAAAIINAAGKIMSSVKLEMEYCKAIGVMPSISFIGKVQRKITT